MINSEVPTRWQRQWRVWTDFLCTRNFNVDTNVVLEFFSLYTPQTKHPNSCALCPLTSNKNVKPKRVNNLFANLFFFLDHHIGFFPKRNTILKNGGRELAKIEVFKYSSVTKKLFGKKANWIQNVNFWHWQCKKKQLWRYASMLGLTQKKHAEFSPTFNKKWIESKYSLLLSQLYRRPK